MSVKRALLWGDVAFWLAVLVVAQLTETTPLALAEQALGVIVEGILPAAR